MALKFRLWIAFAALALGLAIAGAAESATCTCKTAHRTAPHKTAADTVRVYRGVLPEVVTYSGGYVPPSQRHQEAEAAAPEPSLYDEVEQGDGYGYDYGYPYYDYWGWPLVYASFFADRRFNRFRHDGFHGNHVAHHKPGGFHTGFGVGHTGLGGFHNGFGGFHNGGSGLRVFSSPTGIGGLTGSMGGGRR